jgi:hypothetical protein
MKDLAMIRKSVLPCFCLLSFAPLAPAGDLHSQLDKRYQELNAHLKSGNGGGVEAWAKRYCTPSFTYQSKDGHVYKLQAFLKGLKEQVRATKKVSHSTISVGAISMKGSSFALTTKSDFKGLVNFDGRNLTLVDKSETTDTWVRSGNDWKLAKIVQTKADTQMYRQG